MTGKTTTPGKACMSLGPWQQAVGYLKDSRHEEGRLVVTLSFHVAIPTSLDGVAGLGEELERLRGRRVEITRVDDEVRVAPVDGDVDR